MFGNQGGLSVVALFWLSAAGQSVCFLVDLNSQLEVGFVFYPKLLLNLSNCRANEAAPKDKLHLLKFILVDSGEIVRMDVVY